VLFLIENNADILMEKVDNSLPIHDAAFGGHVECAKILLRAGEATQLPSETHLSKRMEGGSSPLHIASKRGHPDLVHDPLPPHSTSPLATCLSLPSPSVFPCLPFSGPFSSCSNLL